MSKIPRRAHPALLAATLLVAGASLSAAPAAAQDEPRFDGVTINLVTSADTDPFLINEPYLPANSRGSILLIDEKPPVPGDLKP